MWKNDRSHGMCKIVFADGNVYIGEMANTKRHGHGKFTYANGTSWHDGEWENDKPKKDNPTSPKKNLFGLFGKKE